MQKIIDRILEGNFYYENGSLDFSCEKIDISIRKGQLYEGSFHIYAPPGLFTDGTVISSDWRMECLTGEFAGSEAEIFFCFHGETLEEGDVVKGSFSVISSRGEYYLPFVAAVEHTVLMSSMGEVRNLFQFANLARDNWQEAVRLFYTPEFSSLFTGGDVRFAEEYRALTDLSGRTSGTGERPAEAVRAGKAGRPAEAVRAGKAGRQAETGRAGKAGRQAEAGRLEKTGSSMGAVRAGEAFYPVETVRAMAAEHSMEEFLLLCGKKQRVEFFVQETRLSVELDDAAASGTVVERELVIARSGWGFTQLFVECQGGFLFTEKGVLTDDDFLGNYCRLSVFFDTSLCRKGRHYGQICLRHSYGCLLIPVEAGRGSGGGSGRRSMSGKKSMFRLMELYQAFRLRKIETSAWLKETGSLVERMAAMDENDIASRLFQAQLLITEGRRHEAGWILDYVSDRFEKQPPEDVMLAYYLYLTTLIHGEESYISQVAGRVARIYRQDPSNWRVAWLLLYLAEEYQDSDRERWQLLEQLFSTGCTSPVLYVEALILLNANPALLHKLGRYEQQIIYYGVRKDFLKQNVVEQVCYLAGRVKGYSEVLLKILSALYERQCRDSGAGAVSFAGKEYPVQDVRLLQELCTLLVKGGKVGKRYFKWYRAGVEAQLRITNLYEYYMMSLDVEEQNPLGRHLAGGRGLAGEGRASVEERVLGETGMSGKKTASAEETGSACAELEIPRTVLMYFSYQNHLDYKRTAFLYEYVLRHRGRLGETYHAYETVMEQFVIDQIQKGHISRHLAQLYQKLLRPELIDEICVPFSRLLFAHLVQVEDAALKKVYVYHPGSLRPVEYPLTEGRAWVSLYGGSYTIAFEDTQGKRFVRSVEYTLEKLMIPGKFLRWLLPLDAKNPELDLYLCVSGQAYGGAGYSAEAAYRTTAGAPAEAGGGAERQCEPEPGGAEQRREPEPGGAEQRREPEPGGAQRQCVPEPGPGGSAERQHIPEPGAGAAAERQYIPGAGGGAERQYPPEPGGAERQRTLETAVSRTEPQSGIARELRVASSVYTAQDVRSGLHLRILEYYYDTDNLRALDRYLEKLSPEEFSARQRGVVIRYLVLRGKYDLAEAWLAVYGPGTIDARVMVQLLGPLMEKHNMAEVPVLTAAAVHVFRKRKYNSTVLEYLAMHYRGMVRNMRHIWKAARSFDVDCYELSERILIQMLYSGAFVGEKMDIFRYYLSQGAKAEVEAAFLAQCAYDYFVRERVMEEEVFHEIRQLYLRGEPVQKICRLAFLKYYAENKEERTGADGGKPEGSHVTGAEDGMEPEAGIADVAEVFLTDLMKEGIRLEFFREFGECPAVRQELADKTILEYRTGPSARVRIHYVIPGGEGYVSEYMKEAYSGVYFKEFVLFFGESLQYYITEEKDGEEEHLTESGTLQKSEKAGLGESGRYQLINEIETRRSLQEFGAMDNLLEEYYRKDFLNGRLFDLR